MAPTRRTQPDRRLRASPVRTGRPVAPSRAPVRQPARAPARAPRAAAARARSVGQHRAGAQQRLRNFRRASILAVAMVGLLLIVWSGAGVQPADEAAQTETGAAPAAPEPVGDPAASVEQAASTIRELVLGAYALLPKLLIAVVILAAAYLLSRLVRAMLARALGSWTRAEAMSALAGVVIIILALGAALSVIAGDARALVGSVGLTGLALSWALQAPIESFTGWLINSFKGYYRVGDRIAVGDVFGDVYRIDILNTTVWESGGEGKAVAGAQPTGALITFPNSEILRSSVINYTRDFPYVWDEVTFAVTNESDLAYASAVVRAAAERLMSEMMREPARAYREMLERTGLPVEIAKEPSVFLSLTEAWTNITVRYLVPARERRRWSSDLVLAVSTELARPEHTGRIATGYPRTEVLLPPPTAGADDGLRPERPTPRSGGA